MHIVHNVIFSLQDENIRLFLEEATAIDPRFKTKVKGNDVWTRLQEAAMNRTAKQVFNDHCTVDFCAVFELLYLCATVIFM